MKKIILILMAFTVILGVYNKNKSDETIKIPSSSIRFRVLANSNSLKDQKIKKDVRDKMQKELYSLLKSAKNKNQARSIITQNMSNFDSILSEEMKDKEYSYKIDYGMHSFPQKTYKGITYEAGEYESLLVTLGEGEGNNWWCVLYPSFCIIDPEYEDKTDKVEYKSYIKELIEKYFKW